MPRPTPEQQREYQREWRATRRAEWLNDKACERCGATHDLQIHHRDPAEKLSHSIWTWREDRRIAELAKCEVLCQSCHKAHHSELRKQHGTVKRYQRGCRCEACRSAKAQANRRFRLSRVGS